MPRPPCCAKWGSVCRTPLLTCTSELQVSSHDCSPFCHRANGGNGGREDRRGWLSARAAAHQQETSSKPMYVFMCQTLDDLGCKFGGAPEKGGGRLRRACWWELLCSAPRSPLSAAAPPSSPPLSSLPPPSSFSSSSCLTFFQRQKQGHAKCRQPSQGHVAQLGLLVSP